MSLAKCKLKMLLWKCANRQVSSQAPLRVSPERFRGNVGRSLVPADFARHDVARIPELQAIPGILRMHRHKHFGRTPAPAGSLWDHHHTAGSLRRTEADLLAHRK